MIPKIFKNTNLKKIKIKIKIMDLNNGYFLGKDNSGFIIWNEKEVKRLQSKDFKDARSRTILVPLEISDIDPLLMELSNLYGYKIQTEAFT